MSHVLILTVFGHGISAIHSIDFGSRFEAEAAGETWRKGLGPGNESASFVVVARH